MNSACAVCKCGHPSINHGDYYCDICQSVDGPGCDRFEAAEPAAKPISAEMALRSLDHQRQAHAAAFLGVPAPPVPLVTIVAEPAAKPGEVVLTGAQLAAKHGFKPLSPEAHRANVDREVRTVVAHVDDSADYAEARDRLNAKGRAYQSEIDVLRAQLAEARAENERLDGELRMIACLAREEPDPRSTSTNEARNRLDVIDGIARDAVKARGGSR